MGFPGKSIMIFGAGVNQLELIREARQLGIATVVIDPQEDPPGKSEADFFYRVDGTDYERNCHRADGKAPEVDGETCPGT
jgi:phosphoribosylaminoimidazole carboxylase (NCAIR synthetase)